MKRANLKAEEKDKQVWGLESKLKDEIAAKNELHETAKTLIKDV